MIIVALAELVIVTVVFYLGVTQVVLPLWRDTSGAQDLVNLLTAKTARELGLDLSITKGVNNSPVKK